MEFKGMGTKKMELSSETLFSHIIMLGGLDNLHSQQRYV